MATPINSIAATFSTTKPSLLLSTPSSLSWNPHSSLSISHKSSLLDLYGSPRPISAVNSPRRRQIPTPTPVNLPTHVVLSHLSQKGVVRSVSLGGFMKGKRRMLVIGVSSAFSPMCERFVKRVDSGKAADLIVCVAANDAYVMGAWGEHLGVDCEKWKMVSDGDGEIWKEIGVLIGRRFWLSASNGIVTRFSLDSDNGVDLDRQ